MLNMILRNYFNLASNLLPVSNVNSLSDDCVVQISSSNASAPTNNVNLKYMQHTVFGIGKIRSIR